MSGPIANTSQCHHHDDITLKILQVSVMSRWVLLSDVHTAVKYWLNLHFRHHMMSHENCVVMWYGPPDIPWGVICGISSQRDVILSPSTTDAMKQTCWRDIGMKMDCREWDMSPQPLHYMWSALPNVFLLYSDIWHIWHQSVYTLWCTTSHEISVQHSSNAELLQKFLPLQLPQMSLCHY